MKIWIVVAAVFVSVTAHANCDQSLALASARYLQALEKAKLQDHQQDPCKVLDAEYKKCTEKAKASLAKKIDLKEMLGNICMPHTTPPQAK